MTFTINIKLKVTGQHSSVTGALNWVHDRISVLLQGAGFCEIQSVSVELDEAKK